MVNICNSDSYPSFEVEPGLKGTAVILAHARARGFLPLRAGASVTHESSSSRPISTVNRSMLVVVGIKKESPSVTATSLSSSSSRALSTVKSRTQQQIDAGTGMQIPSALLNLIDVQSSDGLERAANDIKVLTPDLQERLIQVVNDAEYHFPLDQIVTVFRHTHDLSKASKSLDLMKGEGASRETKLLEKLRNAVRTALTNMTNPETGRDVQSTRLRHQTRTQELQNMLSTENEGRLGKAAVVSGQSKPISFFVGKEMSVAIATLAEKSTALQNKIFQLLDDFASPALASGFGIRKMRDLQIDVKKFGSFARSICSHVKVLTVHDVKKASELRQKYLEVMTQVYDLVFLRCFERVLAEGKLACEKAEEIYTRFDVIATADYFDLQMQTNRFSQINDMSSNLSEAFHNLRMNMEFTPQVASTCAAVTKEDVLESLAALERHTVEVEGGLRRSKNLLFDLKQVETLEDETKKVRSSIEELDFTDAYELRDRLKAVVEMFYEKITDFAVQITEDGEKRMVNEIHRIRSSDIDMTEEQRANLNETMERFSNVNNAITEALSSAGRMLQ